MLKVGPRSGTGLAITQVLGVRQWNRLIVFAHRLQRIAKGLTMGVVGVIGDGVWRILRANLTFADLFVNLFSVYRKVSGRINTDTHIATLYTDHRDCNVVTQSERFTLFSCQD
jgi:hypothetical protein